MEASPEDSSRGNSSANMRTDEPAEPADVESAFANNNRNNNRESRGTSLGVGTFGSEVRVITRDIKHLFDEIERQTSRRVPNIQEAEKLLKQVKLNVSKLQKKLRKNAKNEGPIGISIGIVGFLYGCIKDVCTCACCVADVAPKVVFMGMAALAASFGFGVLTAVSITVAMKGEYCSIIPLFWTSPPTTMPSYYPSLVPSRSFEPTLLPTPLPTPSPTPLPTPSPTPLPTSPPVTFFF